MYVNLAYVDDYVRHHVDELLRESEHERLVAEAGGYGRPVRAQVAEWLRTVADRLEDQPRQRTTEAIA